MLESVLEVAISSETTDDLEQDSKNVLCSHTTETVCSILFQNDCKCLVHHLGNYLFHLNDIYIHVKLLVEHFSRKECKSINFISSGIFLSST